MLKGASERFKTVHPVYNDNGDAMYYHWKIYHSGHTVVRFEGEVVVDAPDLPQAIEGAMREAIACYDSNLVVKKAKRKK